MTEVTQNNSSDSGSLEIAERLLVADDAERADIVHQLRRDGCLSSTVRAFNELLSDPERRSIAASALKAIGLDRAG